MAKASPNSPELQQLLGRRLVRDFRLDRKNTVVDKENRTVRVAITSDEPILHWVRDRGVAWVVLDHKASSINLSRVKARGSRVVDSHDITVRLGFQNNFESDGKVGRVDWRFGPTQRSTDAFAEIEDAIEHGDSPGASAGFTIERFANEIEGYKDDFPIIRALKWTLVHGALTADEADIRCGIGRGMNDDECLRATSADDGEEEEDPAEEADETDAEEAAEETEEAPPKRKKRKRSITPVTTRSNDMADKEDNKSVELTPAQKLTARISEFKTVAEEFAEGDEQKASFGKMARTLAADDSKTLDDLKRDVLAAMKESEAAKPNVTAAPGDVAGRSGVTVEPAFYSVPKNFRGANHGDSARKAYRFAMWALATISTPRSAAAVQVRAIQYCKDQNIPLIQVRGQSERVNELGGYTVPHEFGNDIIALFEQYGDFRRNAKIVPMASDSRTDLRREGGLEAFWEDEGVALEESEKKWGLVGLKSKKLTVLNHFSSEIREDSAVNFGDDLAGEIALAVTYKEDRAGFIGAAEAANGGITGVCTKLTSLKLATGAAATVAQTSGLKVATGTGSYGGILLSDFSKTKAKLPAYAMKQSPKWYINPSFYAEVVEPLIMNAGGITADMIANGSSLRLLGYEVVPTIMMPSIWAIDQVVALFGVLSLAARMGVRRELDIALSEHVRFNTDEIVIRGIERLDINVHDVGGASATASERALGAVAAPGPIVGLITAHT